MADFNTSFTKYILPNEGGYSNVAGDKGGETYRGIARNYHPDWKGWPIVDSKKVNYKNNVIPRYTIFKDSNLDALVSQFYYDWWTKLRMSEVKTQEIADIIFDFYVNSEASAIKKVQKILNISADGVIGSQTIAAINNANQSQLYSSIKQARTDFYNAIVQRDPTQSKFYDGWIDRIEKFPAAIKNNIGLVAGVSLAIVFGIILYKSIGTNETKKIAMSSESR